MSNLITLRPYPNASVKLALNKREFSEFFIASAPGCGLVLVEKQSKSPRISVFLRSGCQQSGFQISGEVFAVFVQQETFNILLVNRSGECKLFSIDGRLITSYSLGAQNPIKVVANSRVIAALQEDNSINIITMDDNTRNTIRFDNDVLDIQIINQQVVVLTEQSIIVTDGLQQKSFEVKSLLSKEKSALPIVPTQRVLQNRPFIKYQIKSSAHPTQPLIMYQSGHRVKVIDFSPIDNDKNPKEVFRCTVMLDGDVQAHFCGDNVVVVQNGMLYSGEELNEVVQTEGKIIFIQPDERGCAVFTEEGYSHVTSIQNMKGSRLSQQSIVLIQNVNTFDVLRTVQKCAKYAFNVAQVFTQPKENQTVTTQSSKKFSGTNIKNALEVCANALDSVDAQAIAKVLNLEYEPTIINRLLICIRLREATKSFNIDKFFESLKLQVDSLGVPHHYQLSYDICCELNQDISLQFIEQLIDTEQNIEIQLQFYSLLHLYKKTLAAAFKTKDQDMMMHAIHMAIKQTNSLQFMGQAKNVLLVSACNQLLQNKVKYCLIRQNSMSLFYNQQFLKQMNSIVQEKCVLNHSIPIDYDLCDYKKQIQDIANQCICGYVKIENIPERLKPFQKLSRTQIFIMFCCDLLIITDLSKSFSLLNRVLQLPEAKSMIKSVSIQILNYISTILTNNEQTLENQVLILLGQQCQKGQTLKAGAMLNNVELLHLSSQGQMNRLAFVKSRQAMNTVIYNDFLSYVKDQGDK